MLCEWEKQIGGDFLSAGSHETECGRKTSMHGDRHHPALTKSEATGKPGTNPRTCCRVIEGRLGEDAGVKFCHRSLGASPDRRYEQVFSAGALHNARG